MMKKTVLFGKESACTEDPAGHDLRTTLVPGDVKAYVAAGFDVVVQSGLGQGIGYSDVQYEMEGARVEAGPHCYAGKDLVIKLKGPAPEEIAQLTPRTTLLTMAHLYCFPDRKQQLADREARVISMENVAKPNDPAPRFLDGIRAGSVPSREDLGERPRVHVLDSADQDYVNGLQRALMRYGRAPLDVVRLSEDKEPAQSPGHHSADICVTASGAFMRTADGTTVDLTKAAASIGDEGGLLAEETTKTARAVGQTREVGIAGARYGLGLYRKLHGSTPKVVVLGYGNVSQGAMELLRDEGVDFTVLGRDQTGPEQLPGWLGGAQLIINGAETPGSSDYIITNEHADHAIAVGSVVIDLIGGSPYRRSPVEPFLWTTFLPEIHFERNGRYFAGLWAWDMYYSMHDTTVNYSRMIKDIFTRSPRYAASLDDFVADYAYAQQLGA
ncbi:hypothetical protein ACFYNY_32965 [Streptomyces sp. NPDC006530]|uniref:hypothetical protein n=1 Tax=Streptomyces sp. NPDC006530 TaxID=3364750 RepID=UPI0036C6DCFD